MASYQYPYQQMGNQFNQFQSIQQMFPQPQGSVYSINTPLDIGNVPIGSTGLSVALCLNEDLMYIKSFQNGNPVIMTYRIVPHNAESKSNNQVQNQTSQQTAPEASPISMTIDQFEKLKQIDALQERIGKLENLMNSKGGKYDDLL